MVFFRALAWWESCTGGLPCINPITWKCELMWIPIREDSTPWKLWVGNCSVFCPRAWAVCSEQWLGLYGQWIERVPSSGHGRTRADWRNTPLWDDISIMEAVCVISANRLGVVRGERSTARTRACNIKMHWTILSNSLLSWSVSSVWFLFQCPQANNYSTYWTALTWYNVLDAITNSNNLAHLNRDGEGIATWNG